MLVVDQLGNESDLVLSKRKENGPIRASTFDLRLPRGVEVREAGTGGGHELASGGGR